MQSPIPFTLIPFATFSLFHTLTFIRSLLPKPPSSAKKTDATTAGSKNGATADKSSPATAGGPAAQFSKTLQVWIKKNYETAMLFVSYYEVIVITGRVVLGALT